MAKPKIKLALDAMTVPQMLQFMAQIAAGLRASSLPNKEALALAVEAKASVLKAAQNDLDLTMNSVKGKTGVRDVARGAAQDILGETADTAQKESGDNPATLTAIGFELASQSRAVIPMTKVENLQLSPGDHAGTVDAHWNPVAGARSYIPSFCVGAAMSQTEDGWKPAMPSTRSKDELTGLPSMQRVWVRVAAVGAGKDNIGPWSEPVFLTVP